MGLDPRWKDGETHSLMQVKSISSSRKDIDAQQLPQWQVVASDRGSHVCMPPYWIARLSHKHGYTHILHVASRGCAACSLDFVNSVSLSMNSEKEVQVECPRK